MADKNPTDNNEVTPKGLSIDELRYRRAYALARYEMARMSIEEQFYAVRNGVGSSFTGRGIAGRLLGSLNYLDWAFLAFRVVSKIKRWRKKSKS
ncbi:MAG: hypothetical protein J6C77_05535 [Muribaculaceae bacterium]|nr:hypothetical protein [Muribaculaceae bacterium]